MKNERLRFGTGALSRNRCEKCKDDNSLFVRGNCLHCGTPFKTGGKDFAAFDFISRSRAHAANQQAKKRK